MQSKHTTTPNINIMSGSFNQVQYEQVFCDKDERGNVIKPLQIDGRNRKQLMEILVTRDPKFDGEMACQELLDEPHICHVLLRLINLDKNDEEGGLTEITTQEEIDIVEQEASDRLRKFNELYFKKNHGGSGERPVLLSTTNTGSATKGSRGRPRKDPTDALQAFINKNHQEGAMSAKQWKAWCLDHDLDEFTPLQFWVDYRIIDNNPSYNKIYKQINNTDKGRTTWKVIESVKEKYDNAQKRYEKAEAKLNQTNTPNNKRKRSAGEASSSKADSDDEDFMSQ